MRASLSTKLDWRSRAAGGAAHDGGGRGDRGRGLVVALIGTGALQIALVVALAMFAALLLSQSPLLVNQAGASAILVVALHRPHGGSQRVLDALAGGAVAILIGAVLFPANPRRLVSDAARQVLDVLADGLERASEALRDPSRVSSGWSLEIARGVHAALAGLAQAQETAAGVVKVAPARRRERSEVEQLSAHAAQLDLLAHAELSLVRRAVRLVSEGSPAPPWLGVTRDSLEAALRTLAAPTLGARRPGRPRARTPWPPPTRRASTARATRPS